MASNPPSPWSFQGPPTLTELVIGVLAAATAVSGLSVAETVAWGWFLAGAVVVVLSLGPLKSYSVATGISARVGEFSEAIGLVGRTLVLLALAAAIFWVISLQVVPGSSVYSLGQGGLLGVAGVLAVKLLRHREIAG